MIRPISPAPVRAPVLQVADLHAAIRYASVSKRTRP
jgi:hypothetical protein